MMQNNFFVACVIFLSLVSLLLIGILEIYPKKTTNEQVLKYYFYPRLAILNAAHVLIFVFVVPLYSIGFYVFLATYFILLIIQITEYVQYIKSVPNKAFLINGKSRIFYRTGGHKRQGGWFRETVISTSIHTWKIIEWIDYFNKPPTYNRLIQSSIGKKISVQYMPISKKLIQLSGIMMKDNELIVSQILRPHIYLKKIIDN